VGWRREESPFFGIGLALYIMPLLFCIFFCYLNSYCCYVQHLMWFYVVHGAMCYAVLCAYVLCTMGLCGAVGNLVFCAYMLCGIMSCTLYYMVPHAMSHVLCGVMCFVLCTTYYVEYVLCAMCAYMYSLCASFKVYNWYTSYIMCMFSTGMDQLMSHVWSLLVWSHWCYTMDLVSAIIEPLVLCYVCSLHWYRTIGVMCFCDTM